MALLISPNLTGAVIADFPERITSILGIFLIIFGVLSFHSSFNLNKKYTNKEVIDFLGDNKGGSVFGEDFIATNYGGQRGYPEDLVIISGRKKSYVRRGGKFHEESKNFPAKESTHIKGERIINRNISLDETVEGLKVIKVDQEKNIIFLKGALPGPTEALVYIRKSLKKRGKCGNA